MFSLFNGFSKKELNDIQEHMFNIVIIASYVLYFLIIFGISTQAPKYLEKLHFFVSIYVSLFLLWRFNPFAKIDSFTSLDRNIAFSAGVFLFTTVIMNNIFIYYFDKQENKKIRK